MESSQDLFESGYYTTSSISSPEEGQPTAVKIDEHENAGDVKVIPTTHYSQSSSSSISIPQPRKPQNDGITIRERIRHFTWAWFTFTMSTGGFAVVLHQTPHQFPGLLTIGSIIYVFNLFMFLLFMSLMLTRWILFPDTLRKSFTNPPECFFYGSFWMSVAVITIGMALYGEAAHNPPHTSMNPNNYTIGISSAWLLVAERALFWFHAAGTIIGTVLQFSVWFTPRTPISAILYSPATFLGIFASMLTGTISAFIVANQPPAQRLPIILAGCAYQGLGFTASLILTALYLARLLERGLPPPSERPGMFVPVGYVGFTIVALIVQARALPPDYAYFARHPAAIDTLQCVALFMGVFLWCFMFWIFMLGVVACVTGCRGVFTGREPRMSFRLSWWAMILPNVGFAVATINIGDELESEAILWVGSAMTILLALAWVLCLVGNVRAVWQGKILWPGKDEDKPV